MKKISATAINALKKALATVYWYKSDLRSFLYHTISNKQILSYLDWNDYKRNICSRLVDLLVKNEEKTQNDLLKLVYEISNMNDFSHLKQLDDGADKVKNAKEAVAALRKVSKGHLEQIKEQEEIENRRKKVFEEQIAKTAVREKLEEVKNDFYALISSNDPQKRGFQLEKLLKDLFNLFDLDSNLNYS